MIAKYHIEYEMKFNRHAQVNHYQTDDPVAAEEFLVELLERGFRIRSIKHEGVPLSQAEFDKMVKTAGGLLASNHIRCSLGISGEEERFRFGFAA